MEAGKSHYYAARETDASPVQVGSQHEKFLFYRGLASFPVPVSAKVKQDGTIAVENTGTHEIGLFVLFEKRGGRLGYRVVRGSPKQVTLSRPILTSNFESLRQDLQDALTEQGLYPREAAAMIETWRDSWFEEGTRLFYVIPRAASMPFCRSKSNRDPPRSCAYSWADSRSSPPRCRPRSVKASARKRSRQIPLPIL